MSLMTCTCCEVDTAACVGRYDAMEYAEPACNECCGHGCEDGHCYVIEIDEDDPDAWSCSCGDGLGKGEGTGGLEGAHAHLKEHMDEMNKLCARRALGEDV